MSAAAFDIRISATKPIVDPPPGQWQNLEEGNVKRRAWIERDMSGPTSIGIETVKSDEVPPYVEIYVDDARVAEGEVVASRTFVVPARRGMHRLEVVVANARTRNATWRLVRVVSVGP